MKDIQECQARLHGLFNITVTPFSQTGEFDFNALAENIERVIQLGFDGLLIGGTYGEFPTMTPAERAELFKQVMAIVGDRVPVMLCSAASDIRIVRELTALAGDLGGVPMVTAPYVSEITDDQIIEVFKQIAPLSKTGIIVYNAPGIGITLSVPVIQALAKLDNVVGVKQGELAPTVIDQLSNTLKGKIRLFCASDLVFPSVVINHFDGISSTNSCALPEIILATYRCYAQNDIHGAMKLHSLWYPLRELARRYGQPQTTKAIMNLRGFKGGYVRQPLLNLTSAQLNEVSATLESLKRYPELKL